MSEYALDASALLAFQRQEPGAEVVAGLLDRAAISTVNLSEVVAKLADVGAPLPDDFAATARLTVVPFSHEHAYRAGRLRPQTKPYGLSLGDRACLALAQQLGVPAVTAERLWQQLPVAVQLIR
ncbi:MAG: type II toxin-antitoxin system VapC family toxin [Chloroflexota bacterium]